MRNTLIAAASTLALMTGAALAQSSIGPSPTAQPPASTAPGTAGTSANRPALTSAEALLGKNVYGKDNQKVGTVDDVVLDPASGQAKQLVVSSGGFLGIGDRKVAVDFTLAHWNAADNRVTLAMVSSDDIKNMSEFRYEDSMTLLNRNRANTGTGIAPATPPGGTSQPRQ